MRSILPYVLFALACAAPLFAGQDAPDAALLTIEEGRVYRKVNDENITGKDLVDLLLEEAWDKVLQDFIDYTLLSDDVKANKIELTEEEVDVEVQGLLRKYAEQLHINPNAFKGDDLAKQVGLYGGLGMLRKRYRINLGMLRVFQKQGKLPANAHTWERAFKEQVGDRIDKLVTQNGVEKDPKKLGPGEAVRIGVNSHSRDVVRAFGVDQVSQVTMDTIREKLKVLTLDRIMVRVLKDKGLELKDGKGGDLEFHYSYLCVKAEAETGIPGEMAMMQSLQKEQMSKVDFSRTRIFRADAALTLLAKTPIKAKELKVEFETHPERYKRSEKLIAHIFIRVLDPDGRGYTPAWKAPGHDALNDYVARKREEQFAAAKPKIEGLVAEAQRDFAAVAKKYSDDNQTKNHPAFAGTIGRIGEQTILQPPADNHVREAALKLKPGEMSSPVRSNYGWHLLKCLEIQDVTFDEAAQRVYMNLIHGNKLKLQDSLINAAKIEDKF